MDQTAELQALLNATPDDGVFDGAGKTFQVDYGIDLRNRRLTLTNFETVTELDGHGKDDYVGFDPRRNNFRHFSVIGGSVFFEGVAVTGAKPDGVGYDDLRGGQHAFEFLSCDAFSVLECQTNGIRGDNVYVSNALKSPKPTSNGLVRSNSFGECGRQGFAVGGHAFGIRVDRNEFKAVGRSLFDIEPNFEGARIEDIRMNRNLVTGKVPNCLLACRGVGRYVRTVFLRHNVLMSATIRTDVRGGGDRAGLVMEDNVTDVMMKSTMPPIYLAGWNEIIITFNRQPVEARRKHVGIELKNVTQYEIHDNDFPGTVGEYKVLQ